MPKPPEQRIRPGSIILENKTTGGEYSFTVNNETDLLERVRAMIVRVFKRKGWDENAIQYVELAIDEAAINAMAHGNLGINTKGLKTVEINKLVREQAGLQHNKNKRIYISFKVNRHDAEVQISDNGQGVDPKILANLERDVLSNAPGQRGFQLIRKICSQIIFEKDSRGRNSVKLVFDKNRSSKSNEELVKNPATISISENYLLQ